MENWLVEYARVLTQLNRENLPSLREQLAVNVEFRDPFNHTHSQEDLISIFADMFERLDDVRFEVHSCILDGRSGVLHWTFYASSKLTADIRFDGMSQVKADDKGQVVLHYDYWDASALMEKIPLVGRLIGSLRKRMSHQ